MNYDMRVLDLEERLNEYYKRIKKAEWALDSCEESASRNLEGETLEAVNKVIDFVRECMKPL